MIYILLLPQRLSTSLVIFTSKALNSIIFEHATDLSALDVFLVAMYLLSGTSSSILDRSNSISPALPSACEVSRLEVGCRNRVV